MIIIKDSSRRVTAEVPFSPDKAVIFDQKTSALMIILISHATPIRVAFDQKFPKMLGGTCRGKWGGYTHFFSKLKKGR